MFANGKSIYNARAFFLIHHHQFLYSLPNATSLVLIRIAVRNFVCVDVDRDVARMLTK